MILTANLEQWTILGRWVDGYSLAHWIPCPAQGDGYAAVCGRVLRDAEWREVRVSAQRHCPVCEVRRQHAIETLNLSPAP